MQNIWLERHHTIPHLLQRRLQDGPPSAFTWNHTPLSLLPAGGLEGGTLKLEKCGFGPSSHNAPSFSVSRGGDVIKTSDRQGPEIRGRQRGMLMTAMAWRRP